MFGGWRTQFAPLRPVAQPLNQNSASLTHLALWITALALGFVAGSEPGAVEGLHHIHLSHGNKRHHIVPIAIHRSPASLRAGHSKYFLVSPAKHFMRTVISWAVVFRFHHQCEFWISSIFCWFVSADSRLKYFVILFMLWLKKNLLPKTYVAL